MSANWYQNKLLIIPILVVSFLAGAISYGMSTPHYALFKLGRAIDDKNLKQVESIIDIKAISKDLVDGVVAEINLEATQKISSGEVTGFGVLGLNAGLNAVNNMKPALEALYTKQGQELLETDIGKFSGSATWFLISQRITQAGDTAVLTLEVPQNKMDLGVSQLEVEFNKIPGTGWKIVGISNQTIHALYEKRQLSHSLPSATSDNSSEDSIASAPSPQVIAPSAPTSTDSESIDNSVAPSTVENSPEGDTSNKFSFPKASCGDKSTGGNDTWYPVFVDGGDLDTIRQQFCADAVATVRKDTKVPTVQLASFVSREQAIEFANAVGGDVGEPTFPDEPQP
jgi:hypothetical protein